MVAGGLDNDRRTPLYALRVDRQTWRFVKVRVEDAVKIAVGDLNAMLVFPVLDEAVGVVKHELVKVLERLYNVILVDRRQPAKLFGR